MSNPAGRSDGPFVAPDVEPRLSLEAVFRALSDRYARYVLYHFIRGDEEVAHVDELAAAVRSIDARCAPSGTDVRSDCDRRALTDDHLPPLVEVGAIEYDARSGTVRYWRQPTLEEYAAHAAYQELGSRAFR
jgi:hypothetical protein